ATDGVQIDPTLFSQYGIRSVPALVVFCSQGYDIIRGNLRVGQALEKVAATGDCRQVAHDGTVAKLAMRQPFVLFKGLTFQKLCLPGAFRPGDHHNK
ncbi:TrbC family F-type conjugative pilus assembly protein, partial [Escherichia coli]|nr:TrbC family F-type conjugative pilus assembly protein [Escherichia coli]